MGNKDALILCIGAAAVVSYLIVVMWLGQYVTEQVASSVPYAG